MSAMASPWWAADRSQEARDGEILEGDAWQNALVIEPMPDTFPHLCSSPLGPQPFRLMARRMPEVVTRPAD